MPERRLGGSALEADRFPCYSSSAAGLFYETAVAVKAAPESVAVAFPCSHSI
jgi:hypothetical protein